MAHSEWRPVRRTARKISFPAMGRWRILSGWRCGSHLCTLGTRRAERQPKRAEREAKNAETKKIRKPGLVNQKLHDDRASLKHLKKARIRSRRRRNLLQNRFLSALSPVLLSRHPTAP